jgi:hypothetical protein
MNRHMGEMDDPGRVAPTGQGNLWSCRALSMFGPAMVFEKGAGAVLRECDDGP